MFSLRSTNIRAAIASLILAVSATVGAQINPNQINWPTGSSGCVYAPGSDLCVTNVPTATDLGSYPALCSGGEFSQGLSSGSNNCGTPSGGGGGLAGVNAQTSSYTAVSGDSGKMIYFTVASSQTFTLPSPPSSTWAVLLSNSWASGASVTIAWPSGTTLDGYVSSCTAQANPGMGGWVFTDGTNFFTRIGAVLTFSCTIPRTVQTAYVSSCTSCTSVEFTDSVSPGSALVIDLFHSNTTVTAPTDLQGDTFSATNSQTVSGEFDFHEYVACGAAGGPTTISFGGQFNVAVAYEIANVATSSCVDGYNSSQCNEIGTACTGSLSTGSVTTTEPYDFILVDGATRTGSGGSTITEGNGYASLLGTGLIDSALTYNSFYGTPAATGSLSDLVGMTNSPGGGYAGILALKPSASSTALVNGDLVVAGPTGAPQALHAGTSGYVLTSNGPDTVPSYQASGGSSGPVNLCSAVSLTNATCSSGVIKISASSASVTISSIPSESTCSNLVLTLNGSQTTGTSNDAISVQFNADTGTHYFDNYGSIVNGTYTTGGHDGTPGGTGASSAILLDMGGTSYPFSASTAKIPFYAATITKAFTGDSYVVTSGSAQTKWQFSGYWNSTAAITSIVLTPASNNFAASSMTLNCTND